MNMARVRSEPIQSLIAACAVLFTLSGCATSSDPEKPFDAIKPDDGWVRLDSAPVGYASMLTLVTDEPYKGDLIRTRYRHVWFSRGTDDYMLYLQVHYYIDPDPGCGDETIEFVRMDGQWSLKDKGTQLCID